MNDFSGKNAWISGASSGIGAAMAKGRDEVFPGSKERLGWLLNRLSPALLRRVMRKVRVD